MVLRKIFPIGLALGFLLGSSAIGERLVNPWELKHYQEGQDLRDVCSAGPQGERVWAVGRDGVVMRSDDLGGNWMVVPVNDDYHFNGVFFTDAQYGYIVGEKKTNPRFGGAIFRTTNGGQSWTPRIPDLYGRPVPFNDISHCFADPYTGYIACGDGYVLRTGDKWETWVIWQPDPTHTHWFWGVWVDPTNPAKVWVAGDGGPETGIVCRSTDGGQDWNCSMPHDNLQLNFLDVAADEWAFERARMAASKGYELTTSDGGASWSTWPWKPDEQWFYALGGGSGYYEFNQHLVGSEGLIQRSQIEESYSRRYVLYGATPLVVEYLNPHCLWAAGSNGAILRYLRQGDPFVVMRTAEDRLTYVHLEWDCDHPGEGTYFEIYHSHQDGGGPYHKVGEVTSHYNVYHYEFNDMTVKARIPYYYKMVYFREYDFYPECVTPSALPPPQNPPVTPYDLSANDTPNDQGGSVTVTWQHGERVSYSYLYRDGEWFRKGGSPEEDTSACTGQPFSYYARNFKYDFPGTGELILSSPSNTDRGEAVDNLAPGVPTGLTGSYDADFQTVRLEWNRNPEMDACGYDVLWSFNAGGPYDEANIPPVPRTAYNDPREQEYSDYFVFYKIRARDHSGNPSGLTNWVRVLVPAKPHPPQSRGGVQSAEAGDRLVPPVFWLGGCSPNPFTSRTEVRYQLPAKGRASLSVYSVKGDLVRNLVDRTQGPGSHSAFWDGTDLAGGDVASGIYFVRLETGKASSTRKVTVLR